MRGQDRLIKNISRYFATVCYWQNPINPLSPNGDQCQFSPNKIHRLSRDKVMRVNKMIT